VTAAAVVAAAGLALLIAAADARLRLAGLLAWAGGTVALAATVMDSTIANLRVTASDRPLLAVAAVLGVALALAAAAAIAYRWPWAFAIAAVAAAPARVPISVGGQSANLLVPLYFVVAAGALATAFALLRGRDEPPPLGPVGWAVAALVGMGAISLAWSEDPRRGAIALLFFQLPFGLLMVRIAQLRPSIAGLRALLGTQGGLAVVFAAVAFWQQTTREVFWNPKIQIANEFGDHFRVNSLFWDASIFGRFMAVTIILLAGLAIHRRTSPLVPALITVLFAALYFAYSQSSMLALAAGVLVLGTALWPRRVTIALAGGALAAGAVALALVLAETSAERATSDRSRLISQGWDVIRDDPLRGAGLGGYQRAAAAHTDRPWRLRGVASHTTPVTVAAELGVAGVAAYVVAAAAVLVAALRGGGPRALRLTLLAALATIAASSLFYDAFFEDPATWILVGLLATVAARGLRPAAAR
jgi:hypothetical protein